MKHARAIQIWLRENSSYVIINAIPQKYKKAIKKTGVQQEHLTEPWENLKVLATKVIHKSLVKYMFEEPTTKQHLIANGLTPDQISKCFNLAFSITIETKLTLFRYKILHDNYSFYWKQVI